ncbi:DEAD/DEAH box helicase [Sphingorhabdus sp. Alg239-R122]|uniref:DEAD/DEAH box helicase n=1 Tax=Sphingorhabdus sp. Alg239-R122 TaxID=2305989 RepID=UPI0013DA005E|nr:DEAD/DEAH box helicase [Sphingorhabdus sp. Alg239-R122]
MPFSSLPATIAAALTEREYAKPTAVQAAVLEAEADGRDMIVSAQTGSGKTVAFGLAIAAQLLEESGNFPFLREPRALIIAPTRELALQVSRELGWLYKQAGGHIATCVGGMDASKERRNLRHGAHVVVGTPGRLRDHIERGALDLSNLKAVVLDEADEMLDMGFRDDLEEILDATPSEERRTLLFSATMPKPIVQLAKRYQNDALRISTVGEDRGHGDISYQVVTVAPADTENAVVNLLRFHEAESAMLFCGTREAVRRLHSSLVDRGFSAVALSGEHTQSERNQAMQALRDKRARVCVATDVAARGLDLPSLSLVIHVEIPRDAETLQHRSGRTGRAGKKGTAVMVVPYQRRKKVERMLGGAKIKAEWMEAPSRADIRKNDSERLMATLLEPVEVDEEDKALAQRLLAEKSAEDIAAALVQAHRAKMPAPEQMLDRGQAQQERGQPRAGFEDTVWFKMDVGHNQRADARWILPVLCRRGHITKNEIGAIRIAANETYFEVPRKVSAKFIDALGRTEGAGNDDTDDINIVQFEGKPRDLAKQNRKGGFGGSRGAGPGGGRRDGGGGGYKGRGGKYAPRSKEDGFKKRGGDFKKRDGGFKKSGDAFKKRDDRDAKAGDFKKRSSDNPRGDFKSKANNGPAKLKPKYGGKPKGKSGGKLGGRPPFKGKGGFKGGKGPGKK